MVRQWGLRSVRRSRSWLSDLLGRGDGYVLDTLIAGSVAAAVSVPFFTEPDNVTVLGALLNAGTVLPLIWRRRAPFAVAAMVFLFAIGVSAHHRPGQYLQYGGLVAIYTIADRGKNWQRWFFFWVIVVTFPPASLWLKNNDAGEFVFTVFLPITAFLLGTVSRTNRERVRALSEYAEQLELARRAEAARAVAQERSRIARDMHDVLAHAVSIMVVQAEAGPLAVRSNPDRAERAFAAIADSGREAMSQLRKLLGLLKNDEDSAERAPRPSVVQIDALLARLEDAGVDVEYTVAGFPRPLPADVDAAGYRIAQEALTNALKHAKASTVTVEIRWLVEAVIVEVRDDGIGPPAGPSEATAGHGLIGMRERAAACGGSVEAGLGATGGFVVTACLPYSVRAVTGTTPALSNAAADEPAGKPRP